MAKIKSSSLGLFSGKIGNVVTYITRGKNIVRIYTDSIVNPRTDKQQEIRARFGALSKLGSSFLDAVNIGYAYRAGQRKNTPDNNFVSGNWEAVSVSAGGLVTVNYSEVVVAEGPLTGVSFGTVDWGSDEHLTIAVQFDGNVGSPRTTEDDEVYIFAYVPDLEQGLLSMASTRSTGTVSIAAPNSWNGMTAHLWGFTVGMGAKNNGRPSDSVYIGQGEVQ